MFANIQEQNEDDENASVVSACENVLLEKTGRLASTFGHPCKIIVGTGKSIEKIVIYSY